MEELEEVKPKAVPAKRKAEQDDLSKVREMNNRNCIALAIKKRQEQVDAQRKEDASVDFVYLHVLESAPF